MRPQRPDPPATHRLFNPATIARLSRARDYVAAHYNERHSLETVASLSDFSPFYFNRLFARAFDETPHEFVTRLRIDQAKKLLLAGNQSITDICFEIGYESLGSFSARFQSLVGLSPSAFRREARRLFGGFGRRWALYYIPHCFARLYVPS